MIDEILIGGALIFCLLSLLCCISVNIGWGNKGWHVAISFGGLIIFGGLVVFFVEPSQTPYISPIDQAYNEGFQEGLNSCLLDAGGK